MIKSLSIEIVERIAFGLARKYMTSKEPIPEFTTRFPNILESCLGTPFQSIGGQELYQGLIAKASILFYLMIKNHPFQNGNKRIAVASLLIFFYINGKWIQINNQEFYNFAMWITQSPAKLKDETIKAIESFLNKHLVDIDLR